MENKKDKAKQKGSILNQNMSLWNLLIASVLVLIFFIIFTSDDGIDNKSRSKNTVNEKKDVQKTLSVGESGIINNNTDCSGATSVGVTKEKYSALVEAITIDDRAEYARMIGYGEAFLVDNCTKVKKIGGSFSLAEISILEGKHLGESGWTAFEFVKKD